LRHCFVDAGAAVPAALGQRTRGEMYEDCSADMIGQTRGPCYPALARASPASLRLGEDDFSYELLIGQGQNRLAFENQLRLGG
jgi:hypothetical protein